MGRLTYSISCSVDVHDTKNMPFDTLKQLFELANAVTRDKIVDMKLEFWTDENQTDAICTYIFRTWMSSSNNSGGAGGNYMLNMTFTRSSTSSSTSRSRWPNETGRALAPVAGERPPGKHAYGK